MDFFNSRYFRINKFFLCAIGLWPYQQPTIKFISLSFAIVNSMMATLPQVAYFFEYWYRVDEMFEIMPTLCAATICFWKVTSLAYNSKKFKELVDLMYEDWVNIPKGRKTQILRRYAETARKFTIAYLIWMGGMVTCYVSLPLSVTVLDAITPKNETKPRQLLHYAEYFVNQEEYYFLLLCFELFAYVGCATIAISVDTIYFFFLEHICGMQSVLCYCLENLRGYDDLRWTNYNPSYGRDEIRRRVRHCIQLDKKIRGHIKKMEDIFISSISIDIGLGFIFHTSTCIMVVIRKEHLAELVRFGLFMVMQSSRIFLISWTGQEVVDHSSAVPAATYNAMWYQMPTEIQKNLMLLMVRSQKPSQLTVAKFYIINLENFSAVMKTSVTYCTVMTSIR